MKRCRWQARRPATAGKSDNAGDTYGDATVDGLDVQAFVDLILTP